MNNDRKNTLCLDGLKGIGAFIIAFMWHYQHFAMESGNYPLSKIFPISFNYGYLMVELFFMLSGFGMMMGYGDKILNHEISFKDYIFKRIKKIYPIFLLTLLLTILFELIYLKLYGSLFIYQNFDIYHLVLNIFCMQNGVFGTDWSFNSPSWCISICLILYCIMYYIVYKSKNKNEVLYKYIFILCITFILKEFGIINALLFRGIMCYSVGVILSFIYENRKSFNYKLIGYISLFFLIGTYYVLRKYFNYVGNIDMLMIIGIGPAIILTLLFNELSNVVLRIKPLLLLGSLSLSIYLFHFPIQCLIKIIDKVLKLHINYHSIYIWIIYVVSVLLVTFIYTKFIDKRYSNKVHSIISYKGKVDLEN